MNGLEFFFSTTKLACWLRVYGGILSLLMACDYDVPQRKRDGLYCLSASMAMGGFFLAFLARLS